MFNPNYCEALVKKEQGSGLHNKGVLIVTLGTALVVLITLFALLFSLYPLLLVSILLGFGTWYLSVQQRIEYEYIFSDDDFTVTKIIAEGKRKPLIEVSMRQVTAFGKLSEASPCAESVTLVLACRAEDEDAYYMDVTHPEYHEVRILFTPTSRCLQFCSDHLSRTLRFYYKMDPTEYEVS